MVATASVRVKTIVVAHGTQAVRDRFLAAFEGAGHQAVAVASARGLLSHLGARHQADLIILDLQLSDGTRLELVQSIRALAPHVPIMIFSSSVTSARDVRDLSTLAIAGYLNDHSSVQHILPSIAPHLFPDNFNRRAGRRVTLGVSVQYRFGDTIAAALTLNVGSGGIAIRTTSPLDPASRIKVRFRIPGARKDVEADGRVTWSDRRVGMGVQFEKVDPASQAIIDQFVDAHGVAGRRV